MSRGQRSRALWDDGWSLAALATVATPLLAFPLIAPGAHGVPDFATAAAVVTAAVEVFAALFLYVHWRLTGGRAGWLVLAIVAIAVQSLALAGSVAARPDVIASHPTRLLLVKAVLTASLLAITLVSRHHQLRVDPLLAGAALGVGVVVARFALVSYTAPAHLSSDTVQLLTGLMFGMDMAVVVALFTLAVAPVWLRARLAIAMTFLGVGHAASYPAPHGSVESTVAVLATLLGATALLTLAMTLLRSGWADNRAALQTLSLRLDEAEAGARREQGRIHELRATISGLSAASRLVHRESSVAPAHRARLEQMIDSELGRLQRLLHDTTGPVAPVDIDATIEPVVMRHRAYGNPIHWSPGGGRAIGRADDVAEIVNVLLENAVQHARGAGANVVTRRVGGVVEVVVSDTGPGVSQAMRSQIFEWGARGQHSHGQGIGLHVAQKLITELGGYLRLIDSEAPGATFVLGLPAEEQS